MALVPTVGPSSPAVASPSAPEAQREQGWATGFAVSAGAWPGAHWLEWMDVLPSAQGCAVLPGAQMCMLDLSCVALDMLLNLSVPQFPQPGSVC